MEDCIEVKKKQIIQEYSASGRKEPTNIVNPKSFYDQTPVWSFWRCDFEHDRWGIGLHNRYLPELLRRLKAFEGMKWKEILSDTAGRNSNTKNHIVAVSDLDKKVQKRLEELKLDDFDEICSLTITGVRRLWGIVIDGTFYVVWFDVNHEIYPSSKRHT